MDTMAKFEIVFLRSCFWGRSAALSGRLASPFLFLARASHKFHHLVKSRSDYKAWIDILQLNVYLFGFKGITL